jgi:hypothetical protein
MVVFVIRIFAMLSLLMGLVPSLFCVLAIMIVIVVLVLCVRSMIMRLFRVIDRHLFFCPRIARRQQPETNYH